MPNEKIRYSLITFSLLFFVIGSYYRVQSQRSGERLDRTKEGWPILIGIRLFGLLTLGSTALWLWNPARFTRVSWPLPEPVRWLGVVGFALAVAWLLWMFHALGKNLTDTVVTRRNSYFVDYGPYRFVRNPMYTGVLLLGLTLGLALGTWLIPLAAIAMFTLLSIRTRAEERYLLERFGHQYESYMKRVGRFFPNVLG